MIHQWRMKHSGKGIPLERYDSLHIVDYSFAALGFAARQNVPTLMKPLLHCGITFSREWPKAGVSSQVDAFKCVAPCRSICPVGVLHACLIRSAFILM